jgi:hypothetical protein
MKGHPDRMKEQREQYPELGRIVTSRLGLVDEVREEDNWLLGGDRGPLADPGDLCESADPCRTGVKKEWARAIAGAGSGGS